MSLLPLPPKQVHKTSPTLAHTQPWSFIAVLPLPEDLFNPGSDLTGPEGDLPLRDVIFMRAEGAGGAEGAEGAEAAAPLALSERGPRKDLPPSLIQGQIWQNELLPEPSMSGGRGPRASSLDIFWLRRSL